MSKRNDEAKRDKDKPSGQQQRLTVQQALDLAVRHHGAGDLVRAESIYRQILRADPNQPVALQLRGVLAHQVGKIDVAVDLISRALAVKPDYPEAHNNLGNVLKDLGRPDDAVASYRKALAGRPEYPEAHYNLANALRELGRPDDAVASYHKALAGRPDYADAHFNLGNALRELGRLDDAVAAYHKALAGRPDYFEAHINLGATLKDLGRLGDAVTSYHDALALKPDHPGAHSNLAFALNALGRREEALAHFKQHLELDRGRSPIDPDGETFRFITKAKMNHDIEQFRYLEALGIAADRFKGLAQVYEAVDREIEWPDGDTIPVPLADDHRRRIGDTYNRPIHLFEAPRVAGSALAENLDVGEITRRYFGDLPSIATFDDFLAPDALAALRRVLLESTIWFDSAHHGGYLGAYLKDGLACPLVLQIAEDLRRTFPEIFKDHPLNQLWAYKYDSRLTGINVHADFAAVNVNFWVTPNSANLNPDSGGLVVYKAEAPLDWNFKTYNNDEGRIRRYLAEHDSGKMVVHHANNRAVLFDSDLFHETETIDFKEGYENRRMNVTMLFGNRGG